MLWCLLFNLTNPVYSGVLDESVTYRGVEHVEEMLDQIRKSWAAVPQFGIGKLLKSAAEASSADKRQRPENTSHDDLLLGLRMLIPDEDEL